MPMDQSHNLAEHSAAEEAGERLSPSKMMPLGEHLEELRRHIVYALIGVGVALIVAVVFSFQIIAWLQSPLLEAQYALGYTPQTVATDATFGFMTVYVPVSLIAAVVLAGPWIVYQLWRFVESGLYPHEKKAAHLLAPFSAVMTVLAILFTRYALLPVCIVFFLKFAALYPEVETRQPGMMIRLLTGEAAGARSVEREEEGARSEQRGEGEAVALDLFQFPVVERDPNSPSEGEAWINRRDGRLKVWMGGRVHVMAVTTGRLVAPLPDLPKQVKFAAAMGLGVVIAFHLPLIMLVIGWTGLVDPDLVAKQRKYAVFGSFALGALLTPADLMSMFVLAVPLYGLFELGLALMRWADRGQNREPEGE
ncbi:MAG: twin-arginine translocase subunit TatC [Phycisphaeraceae bacterium]